MNMLPVLLSTLAFTLLGLGTDPHHRRLFGRPPQASRRRMLRIGGWLALIACAAPSILARGWIFGPILWAGAIMTGAGIAFLALNLLPPRADAHPPRSSV